VQTAKRRIGAQSWSRQRHPAGVRRHRRVLWSGAHDVIDGRLSAGTLGQFVLYALIGGGSVAALAEVWNDLQRATGGMGRIGELLGEHAAILCRRSRTPAATGARRHPVRHVVFHYPRVRTRRAGRVQPARASRRDGGPGRPVGRRQEHGAVDAAALPRSAGRAHHRRRHRLRQLDPAALRTQLALVPQQPTLFAASAADNIRYGRLQADDAEVRRARAEADGFIRALPQGYASELGERGARLSGGQQQRIAIARALLKDAPILLLDEATSALDAQSERAVQQALERLMAGRTTLVIAHRLATVLKADRIVVMDRGRVVAEGTHAQLLAKVASMRNWRGCSSSTDRAPGDAD
jgi:ATP-binding cassette subfamily B protein